jgi:transcriptional regulator with XRE-family HTH domain
MTRLERIRRERGIPYYVLARRANSSVSTILLWEKHGLVPKRRDVIERIARVLGVEPEELLENAENAKEVSDA